MEDRYGKDRQNERHLAGQGTDRKGFSLIVGLALAAVALIALANGHGALGIFAANHVTELVWGAAACC
ncbi:MAG: hypothetical protein WBP81_17845 [Solirubrobacteraceae bacterium]